MEKVNGVYFWDVDGNKYIDYLVVYGLIIIGYVYLYIIEVIKKVVENGVLYGILIKYEVIFVKMFKEVIFVMDKVRFVNLGIEVVMMIICVVCVYIGWIKIIKFVGCYYGYLDFVFVVVGFGLFIFGILDLVGVLKSIVNEVIIVLFNDIESYKVVFDKWGSEIVVVFVELIVGNFGIVELKEGFLEKVNELIYDVGVFVIYDEVIMVFCFMYGGVQDLLQVKLDLIVFGKIIGGGFLIGVYGGKKEIMEQVVLFGLVYQVGIMVGNFVLILLGIVCLEVFKEEGVYEKFDYFGVMLEEGILQYVEIYGIIIIVNCLKGVFMVYFFDEKVENYEQVECSDGEIFVMFFKLMLECGINLVFFKYEVWFIIIVYIEQDIKDMFVVVEDVFKYFKKQNQIFWIGVLSFCFFMDLNSV